MDINGKGEEKSDEVFVSCSLAAALGSTLTSDDSGLPSQILGRKRTQHEMIWAMVNTHYMVDGHPIHNKDPYNIMVIINPYEPLDD